MSEANDCMKLLDNRTAILLFRNQLQSYTAVALRDGNFGEAMCIVDRMDDTDPCITEDFTPEKVLYRLTEKQFGNIVTKTPGEENEQGEQGAGV